MNVRFLTIAQQEVDEAFIWFDERTDRKGLEFLDELDRVVRLVKAYPLASPEIDAKFVDVCLLASPSLSCMASTMKRSSSLQWPTLIVKRVIGSIALAEQRGQSQRPNL